MCTADESTILDSWTATILPIRLRKPLEGKDPKVRIGSDSVDFDAVS